MQHSIRTRLAGVVAGGALAVTVVGGTAFAVAPRTLDPNGPAGNGVCTTQLAAARAAPSVTTLRAFGDCEIDRRFATLSTLTSRIDGSKVMTAAHRTALSAEIGATTAGLTNLKSTIDTETSIPALRTEIARIATEYRVYLLVCRQVHLVNAADGAGAAATRFDALSARLAERIEQAKAAGKDVTKAQADLDAMNAAVSNARNLASPLPAKLVPLTPAQYNAGTARPVLDAARGSLVQATGLLKTARADAAAVVADLK